MTDQRPAFRHTPERRGLIGPFSGRRLLFAFGAVIVAIVGLTIATTPLGNTAGGPVFEDPQATPFIIGEAVEGLHVGDLAPDFDIALPDGSTYQLHDVDGNPVSLEDLRGKAVWINFFASWCPPCQGETPVLREVAEKYKDQGLEVVAVSVQETTADDRARIPGSASTSTSRSGSMAPGTCSTSTASTPCRPSSSWTRAARSATSPRGHSASKARPSGSRPSCRIRTPVRRRPEGAQRRANARFCDVSRQSIDTRAFAHSCPGVRASTDWGGSVRQDGLDPLGRALPRVGGPWAT